MRNVGKEKKRKERNEPTFSVVEELKNRNLLTEHNVIVGVFSFSFTFLLLSQKRNGGVD